MYNIDKYKKLAMGNLTDDMIPDIINEEWLKYALPLFNYIIIY